MIALDELVLAFWQLRIILRSRNERRVEKKRHQASEQNALREAKETGERKKQHRARWCSRGALLLLSPLLLVSSGARGDGAWLGRSLAAALHLRSRRSQGGQGPSLPE